MKRSLFFAAMILVCLMIFTACGCEHVWEEATCMAPKTCSACGETEGDVSGHAWAEATCDAPKTCTTCGKTEAEPLVHNWAEATCSAPKTCTLCGKTEGAALEHNWEEATCLTPATCSVCGKTEGAVLAHTFGNWYAESYDADTMGRTCLVCQTEETAPVNHMELFGQRVAGHWDFIMVAKGSDYIDAYQLSTNDPGYYLQFYPDGTSIFYDLESIHQTQWTAHDFESADGVSEYTIKLSIGDLGEMFVSAYEPEDGSGDVELYLFGAESIVYFTQHKDLASALTGVWKGAEEGRIYQANLYEDRTFTSDMFGKEITGTWHIRPLYYNSEDTLEAEVLFLYTCDGEDRYEYRALNLGTEPENLKEYLEYNSLQIQLSVRDDDGWTNYCQFSPVNEEANQKLAGLWESTRIISRTENDDLLKDESTNAYSIAFMEDGTFTAVLDKELQGTWMFYKKSLGLNDSANYHYILCFDDGAYEARALLYGDELSVYTQDQPTSNKVEFIAMTEEAIAKREALRAEVANLVSGEWTGTYGSLQNLAVGSGEIEAYQQTFDYSITFAEDGTFTATLDQDYTGTWTFLESIKVDDPQYAFSFTYMYRLNCDGLLDGAFVSVYAQSATDSYEAKASQSCSLQITYSPDGDDRSGYFNFQQFSPESLQKVQEAAKEIVGSWTAVSATSYTREWSKIKNIPDCKYTLTVYADGTYTVVLDRTYTGTWIYDCNPHPDYDTSYHFSNSDTNSTIELDGTLSFRHYYADGYVEVTFRRNER